MIQDDFLILLYFFMRNYTCTVSQADSVFIDNVNVIYAMISSGLPIFYFGTISSATQYGCKISGFL